MADSGKIQITNKGTGITTFGDSAKNLMDRKKDGQHEAVPDTTNKMESPTPADNIQPNYKGVAKQPETTEKESSNEKVRKESPKDIENLEQFIAQAYARPGQRITLKPKTEEVLGKNPKMSEESRARLLESAKRDWALAVPRQLLLVSRDIKRFPLLKNEIRDFLGEVLAEHPVIKSLQLGGVLRNLPDAPEFQRALTVLADAKFAEIQLIASEKPPKPKQIEDLRTNVIYCLVVWVAETRSLSFEKVIQLLFASFWKLRAESIKGDTAKLRCITDIKDLSGVGLACATYKQETDLQAQAAAAAEKSRSAAQSVTETLQASLVELRKEIDARDQKIEELLSVVGIEKQAHMNTRTHLRDDHERLRARMLRRLKSEVSLLSEGLHALRREDPKLHVVEDHTERVLDGLIKEIKELESGD